MKRREFLSISFVALATGCSTITRPVYEKVPVEKKFSFQAIETFLTNDENVRLRSKHFISQDRPTLIVIGEFHRKKDVQVDQYRVLENIIRNTGLSLLLRENHPKNQKIDLERIKPIFKLYGEINSAVDLSKFYGDKEDIGKLFLDDGKLVRKYLPSLPPASDFYALALREAYNLLTSSKKLSNLERGILSTLERTEIPVIDENNFGKPQNKVRVDQAAASIFAYNHQETPSFGVDSDVIKDKAIDTLDGLFYALNRVEKTRPLTSDEKSLFFILEKYEQEFVINGRSQQMVKETTGMINTLGSNISVLIIGHAHEKSAIEALRSEAVNFFYLTVSSMDTYRQEDLFTIKKK